MNLEHIHTLLGQAGFTLEAEQPHISGERFLMAKEKLVLVARRNSDDKKVVCKVSNTITGKKEISDEKHARDLLKSISFANRSIIFPEEILWSEKDGHVLWAIEYIDQNKVFVEYSVEEQFFIILEALEEQESFHATTYEHIGRVKKIFPILGRQEYLTEFSRFQKQISENYSDTELEKTLHEAETFLIKTYR
jgi:hypothetical protein